MKLYTTNILVLLAEDTNRMWPCQVPTALQRRHDIDTSHLDFSYLTYRTICIMALFGSYKSVNTGRKGPSWKGEDEFNALLREANAFVQRKEYISALKKYIAAKRLSPGKESQLMSKISKIKDKCWDQRLDETKEAFEHVNSSSKWYRNIVTDNYHINHDTNNDDEDSKKNTFDYDTFEYTLPCEIYDKLYEYQRECLVWFYTVFKSKNGGILGDDMGLGKTVQMSAYLHGAFYSELIRCVMLIVPVSVISHWVKELKTWCKGTKVRKYYSSISTEEREENLALIANQGGILITTYGMVQRNHASMGIEHIRKNKNSKWDYMILDEGHIIKNHAIATSKAVRQIAVKNSNKIILSGTFLQNELSELWSLFSFISEGNLFGTYEFFNQSFASKINAGRLKNATEHEQQLSVKLLNLIKKISAPYLLSRSKADVRGKQITNDSDTGNTNRQMLTCQKRELVVWIQLSDIQTQMYRVFLESDIVEEALNASKSPLAALTVLKKICDHPFLLLNDTKMSNCSELDEIRKQLTADESIENTLLTSAKMDVLLQILAELMDNEHRVLVFSQSKNILSIIGAILRANKVRHLRMDGETKVEDRQKYVNLFNKKAEIKVFLLSTKVGGLGLNLVGSDRVIIYDPAWNPAIDAQAVDRAYRIGQVNDVMVYRFVTCGTIEEKIYRRQISKVGLLKSVVTNNSNQERYFTKHELNKQMLQLQDHRVSKTQIQLKHLNETRKSNNQIKGEMDAETDYVENIDHVFGISHHDLLFKASDLTRLDGSDLF
eukprot:176505_1